MVERERLKQWVEEKLEQGVSEERLKENLEKTGHDPSIVDEVQDPFEDVDVGTEDSTEEQQQDAEFSEDEPEDSTAEGQGDIDNQEQVETDRPDNKKEDGDTQEEDSGSRLPSFSLPNLGGLPVWPAVVATVLVLGLGGYFLVPWSSIGIMGVGIPNISFPAVNAPDLSSINGGTVNSGGKCPDVGVRINSVSTNAGSTTAEVLVTRDEAEVVLEVYRNGNIVGSNTARISGEGSIKVDATGDKAVFRPQGCTKFKDEARIQ